MKRILALVLSFLLIAALFPASVAQADTVSKQPFYFLNFDRTFNTADYNYVYWEVYTWINSSKFDANSEAINIGVYFSDTSSSVVDTAAKMLYEEFKDRPEGTRFISLNAMKTVFEKCVKDAVDMEDGVRLVKEWLGRFLDAYKALGGELDGLNIDLEYNYAYNHYIETQHYNNSDEAKRNRNIYNDIVANKVYQNRIRPRLVEFEKQGLWHFYENPDPVKYPDRSEIWTMYRHDSGGGNATCRGTWNRVIGELLAEYINEATYEPLIARYPNAILSDYNRADTRPWNKTMSTSGEATGNGVKVGNTSDKSFYNSTISEYYFNKNTNKTARTLYYKPVGSNDAVYNPETPYGRVLIDINTQKNVLASTLEATPDNKNDDHVNVHVAFFNYGTKTGYANTPYFTEMIYHMGMTDPKPFFGYILPRDIASAGIGDYALSLKIADEHMIELTRVAGASDRKAIVTPIAWNEDYILSGMYAGGRNIWRLTPNTNVISKADFKVKDTAPTFSVNGVTITFPQGRIIEDSTITQVGSCGYWIETPANVTPVVTAVTDRYAQDPSFYETFGRYDVGAFTGSRYSLTNDPTVHKDTYWTATGTAEIVEQGGDKAIALNGTTTLLNDKVPANITAGDNYAKQQAWEVTVTLPVASAYKTVTLLNFDDADTSTTDAVAGFTLSGGQVRYADKTIANVDLSGGGTFTFKLALNLPTDNAHTAGCYVYDATGNLLGSLENVKLTTANIALPVSKITMTTTNATAAVKIDDYKLYPMGVATDLELYDATIGKKLTDLNASWSADTAYRLSWMNATDKYQVARIYDANTGTILKKIEMAPGMDGVVTGIVEIGAGRTIRFAVNVNEESAPTQPNYDNGNFSWTAVSESIGLATGEKPAGGNDSVQEEKPPVTDDKGEEGENIFDIIGGDSEDLNNGSSDPIIPGSSNNDAENPGDLENPDNSDTSVAPEEPEGEGLVDADKKEIRGGAIALIVTLSLVILGGGAAAYIFWRKPKRIARWKKQNPEA